MKLLEVEVDKLINRIFQIHVTNRMVDFGSGMVKFKGKTRSSIEYHVKLDNYKHYTVKLIFDDKCVEFLYEQSSKLKCVLILLNGVPVDIPKYVYEIFEQKD